MTERSAKMIEDHEVKETVKQLASALEDAKLTPAGIEQTKRDIRKGLKASAGLLGGAVLLFLLLLDTKVHGDYSQLGQLAAVVLGILALVGFVFGIACLVVIWKEWREVRRSQSHCEAPSPNPQSEIRNPQ